MLQIPFPQLLSFRNDMQNKITPSIEKWQKSRIYFLVTRQPKALFQLEWYSQNSIKLFPEWSNDFPNINLRELLWLQMKQLPSHKRILSNAGLKKKHLVWKKIMLSYLKSLYKSMQRIMQAGAQAQGSYTKYRALIHDIFFIIYRIN